jgi:predicted RNA polymerase sigma factor
LFQLLWDAALERWDSEEATASYMRALWLTSNNEEMNYLKQKILEINQLK